ncbi:MAG: prephenate dehydratase [Candidatus Methanospirareceae archaeon]
MRIGVLGPEGTFSEDAARLWIKKIGKDKESLLEYYETISDVAEALLKKDIDYGIVPIENSLEGSVGETLDVLSSVAEIRIIDEVLLKINICLLAKNNIPINNIRKVLSHSHALAQCRQFIRKHLKGREVKFVESTASAAALAAKDENIAALASKEAAKRYKLTILKENVQDEESITRFVVLATSDAAISPPTGNDKTSILIYLKDKPGALYEVLGEFAERKINLTKIESRPSKKALGDYMFHIDCEGHIEDEKIKEALEGVKNKVVMLKFLGSYPVGRYE